MENKFNRDRAAFPWSISADIESTEEQGLTKHEYFAAMAMQGMLAAQGPLQQSALSPSFVRALTSESVAYADELLKQLEATE